MSALPRVSDSLLVPWLGALSLLGTLAVLQALLFPSGPRVEELPLAPFNLALRRAALEASPLPPRPERRTTDKAQSRQLGWRFPAGAELWILHGSVRRYENLQAAYLAEGNSDLALQQRRLDQPIAGSAEGAIGGHPAVQTCLVPQSQGLPVAAVTRNALLRASDPRRHLPHLFDQQTMLTSLAELLGPRRFSCVLVTLRSGSTQPLPDGLWARTLPPLQAALQAPKRP
jgi:hypothetical protein